jgi:hypothetical protein
MSGLLGPVVAQGITPDSGQGQLATAISSFFGGGTPQFSTPTPQAAAPAPDPTYDKWGHVVTGSPQGQVAAPAAPAPAVPSLNVGPGLAQATPQAAPGAINPGASGYDMWGRQAPVQAQPQAAPQLPGLADILAMIQAEQARQARANQNAPQGLLGGGGNEAGGDQGSADHGGADSGVI